MKNDDDTEGPSSKRARTEIGIQVIISDIQEGKSWTWYVLFKCIKICKRRVCLIFKTQSVFSNILKCGLGFL